MDNQIYTLREPILFGAAYYCWLLSSPIHIDRLVSLAGNVAGVSWVERCGYGDAKVFFRLGAEPQQTRDKLIQALQKANNST